MNLVTAQICEIVPDTLEVYTKTILISILIVAYESTLVELLLTMIPVEAKEL